MNEERRAITNLNLIDKIIEFFLEAQDEENVKKKENMWKRGGDEGEWGGVRGKRKGYLGVD